MFFDYDNDGWLDIYLVNGRYRADVNDNTGRRLQGKLNNRLYHNNHDGTFTDVTGKAGVGGGDEYGVACSAADYDGDGNHRSLRVQLRRNILYHNNGDGTFTDVTKKAGSGRPAAGASPASGSTTTAMAARCLRGQLPRVRRRQVPQLLRGRRLSRPPELPRPAGSLYHNNGDGTFTDVTKDAGVNIPEGRAMSATAADLRNTGTPTSSWPTTRWRTTSSSASARASSPARRLNLAWPSAKAARASRDGPGVRRRRPRRPDWTCTSPTWATVACHMNRGDHFEDQTNASGLP